MALKGKRKSQQRGSQGRRRPAAAPRPVVQSRRRPAWYRTGPGRALAGIVVIVLIGGIIAAIATSQSDSGSSEAGQEALDDYTGEIRGILQGMRAATGAMSTAPTSLEDSRDTAALAENAAGWAKALKAAEVGVTSGLPPPSARSANQLFLQSVLLYQGAAKTYRTATEIDGAPQADVLARAGEQRDSASQVWLTATELLDAERANADLRPSALLPPSLPAPTGAQPGAGGGNGGGNGAGDQGAGSGGNNSGAGGEGNGGS